jgi:hypothetical protein
MITQRAIDRAAQSLGVKTAVIRAVMDVESKGDGFLPSGDVKILFEPHIFWKELKKVKVNPADFVKGNEDILYPVWGTKLYGKYSEQWAKLQRAMLINNIAALCSASWGAFQIMGFNWPACAASLDEFVKNMRMSEDAHLTMFVDYIKSVGLQDELQNKDWAGFARGYNGPSYARNNYDKKLAAAYSKYA